MIRLAFFGHNLNEPAVRKRAGAFMQAGCEVIGIMPHRGVAKARISNGSLWAKHATMTTRDAFDRC